MERKKPENSNRERLEKASRNYSMDKPMPKKPISETQPPPAPKKKKD